MRVLSVTHGPSVPGGVFDEAVEAAGHRLERWSVPEGGTPGLARSYGACAAASRAIGTRYGEQET